MKVYINLTEAPLSGGMHRVYEGLTKYLPTKGIEIVDDPSLADVYHAHINLYNEIPASMPLVVSSHGMLWDSVWGNGWSTNRHLIESYRQADVITTPSKFVADSIARNMLRKPLIVHHGIDSETWIPGDNHGYVLWNKARVDAANDPDVVNELAHMALDVPFKTTFGDPTENVEVLGQLPPDEILDVVQHAAVYLDTALESGGPCFGVLEALSCGIPVLAWREGGNAEVIEHKHTGYLATPGDYVDLFAGLQYCLQNREELSKNARQCVLDYYQWETVIDGYIDAYEQAIQAHQHPVKVSVIIPCYNLSKFLPFCLDSVITQSFQDWEAIVVDDASTDNSYAIMQEYASNDARIKIFQNSKNLHVADARNRAVSLSSGEYVYPLDADDRLVYDALEKLVNHLDAHRELAIVTGNLLVHDENDLTRGYNGGWPNNADVNLQLDGYNRLPYASMYRRQVWETIGGYRRRIRIGVEDADFWTRALSYGFRAEVLPDVTLLYTQRSNSLRSANPNGAAAWLGWFPFTRDKEKTPFGAVGFGPYRVDVFTPQVSVIIPVGPGHAHHIQGCLDSLLAQTYEKWEAVVVNDTGKRWFDDDGQPLTQYVTGFPFVTFVDTNTSSGVAHARNLGIARATTDKIVFLDVDDIAQPAMLDILMKARQVVDGWIYGDWYTFDGTDVNHSDAPDWTIDGLRQQSLAPITGIYDREYIEQVGGFDEYAPGWEDWDFQLRLLENGICGTRIKFPLLTYHMHLGARREDNFSQREDLVKYIVDRHPLLYKEGKDVACRKCGGHTSLNVQAAATAVENDQYVLIRYTGPEINVRYYKSPSHPERPPYRVSNKEPFWVHPADVNHFLQRVGFVLEEVPKPPPSVIGSQEAMPLISNAAPVIKEETMLSWDTLQLKPEVITILKDNFGTPLDVIETSDTKLLAIKGIGDSRLGAIRKALANAT